MRIDIISVKPELLTGPFDHSIIARAKEKGLLEIYVHNLRDYGIGKHKVIDDYQYGGGAGMVMMCGPLDDIITDLKSEREYSDIIYLTPDGVQYNQGIANHLSLGTNIMMICGHYKGIDERIREMHVTKEISIGDYVLSGGELAAAVMADSIGRLLPGVLGDETSALFDSHQDGLLAPPVYTRPEDYKGNIVPSILLSGNNKAIDDWRNDQAEKRTEKRRPDMM
ncbi:tRNA (guanosine(37)-N1)-methyltransferase TrmD [Saprospiraceae bacterium]|jgi:tRNA (guanine37-N1)-methyltransferase|nr:tRNA (guanosine(37)-N1)-methyltransferase TrmD [Saprospiraceae bacterium]MDA9874064.1 tRNA (guanosine(37)-N1)-methyltransferase TrmD [Saprospiraceae bacterium]HAV29431.1 tRNA (guanosine(37)-N1)-methyltransferase TrmD [Saprospirales bacterium]|tara:strand:- start:112 stop:783 length:672 start_codon:yes stop_codon:yes gene_type:complete